MTNQMNLQGKEAPQINMTTWKRNLTQQMINYEALCRGDHIYRVRFIHIIIQSSVIDLTLQFHPHILKSVSVYQF